MRARAIAAALFIVGGLCAGVAGARPAFANNGDSRTLKLIVSPDGGYDADFHIHYGQKVGFNVIINDDSGSCGFGDCDNPLGHVDFFANDVQFGTAPVIADTLVDFLSTAGVVYAGFAPGSYQAWGIYRGSNFNDSDSRTDPDATFEFEKGPTPFTVVKEGTQTSMTAGSNPAAIGSASFTVVTHANHTPDTADGAHVPGDSIDIVEKTGPTSTAIVATHQIDPTGTTVVGVPGLAVGHHTLFAHYRGDTNYTFSDSADLDFSVVQGQTTNDLSPASTSAVFGQTVTLTNTVAAKAPATGTPTGASELSDQTIGGTTAKNLDGSGQAVFQLSAIPVGPHSFKAHYPGDTNFTQSDSNAAGVTVSKADSTTALTSTSPSSVGGQAVTFTATVSPVAPSTATPDGTVQFKDGSANLGTARPLTAGVATLTTSVLAPGPHSITAVYGGSSGFNGSQSSSRSQPVTCDKVVTGSAASVDGVSGTTCVASANIGGNIKVPAGGKLLLLTDTVGGTLNVTGAGQVIICGSTFGGNVKITGDNGFLLLGDPADDGCAGNTFNSGVTLGSNTAGLALVGNKIAGGVSITGNSGAGPVPNHTSPKVGGNTINGNLACSGDNPVMTNGGSPNSVSGNRSGECGAAGF